MHVWNWFAAPYLHLPLMTLWVSVGIGFWARSQTYTFKVVEDEKIKVWTGILYLVLGHSMMLAGAYLIHRYAH